MQLTIGLDNALASGATTNNVFGLSGFNVKWFDGVSTFDTDIGVQTIDLTTDAAGAVIGWDFSVFTNATFNATFGNSIGAGIVGVLRSGPGGVSQANRSDDAGTWTVTTLANAVPEPATLALVGIAMAGLASLRRKR